jgi:phosphoribosylamine---glycine ligase
MNILILGGGGREHALAWAVSQNPKCGRLIVAPGNAGIAGVAELADLPVTDGDAVAAFCAGNGVDFVIVGPEAPLAAGVADRLRAGGILTFGPSAAAARLESSKAFAREICDAAGIPGPRWARFDDAAAARAHLRATGAPVVVKADGLAAGKGVTVAPTLAEAEAALDALFADGPATVVIEACLTGVEASLFALCHGTGAVLIGTAQDHKRLGDGDSGPNTGGMGAFSPAPAVTGAVADAAMARIVRPALAEMARRGTPFEGVLYAGLMIADGTPRLIEFNTRFGDPEAQVLAMRLGAQLLDLMLACARGDLAAARPVFADDHALCVVMAAPGYPGAPRAGDPIGGLDGMPETSDAMLFHAGTAVRDGRIVSAGGRVLNATARAATLAGARARAYALVDRIDWQGAQFRRDIGAARE